MPVAFFEYADATPEPFVKAAGVPHPRASHFDHLALNLLDEETLLDLRRRLKDADCEVTDIIDHGAVRSIYFTDPNGIALEASWWVHDPTQGQVDYDNALAFADPRPVPAVEELRSRGEVLSVLGTSLARA